MPLSHLINFVENPSPRWLLSFSLAGTVLMFLPSSHWEFRMLAAWDVGVLCLLGLIWLMMLSSDADRTRERAQRQEVDHRAIFLLIVFLAFSSLFAIATVLAKHKDSFTSEVGLSIVAIFCSWLLAQTVFTLHYAAFFYRRNPPDLEQAAADYQGGLEFSSDAAPNYLDFVYFTFTLGMTSQTSDTMVASSAMRRLVLGHTVISFYFYSVVLALSVSIVSGLL